MSMKIGIMALALLTIHLQVLAQDRLVYQGEKGAGNGKHIVLIAGDEEYRSEEALPMLARILSFRHGFKCTLLFSQNPADGSINPNNRSNIPGLEELDRADLLILFTRFRELSDAQMKHFDDFLRAGKPILGIRTATHAFSFEKNPQSPYARWDWRSKEWSGGFGQQVLGATWGGHHGEHGKESTRGIINPQLKSHPILRGVGEIWGPSDVYAVLNLPSNAETLVFGQVIEGMRPTDRPVPGAKNNTLMPLIWIRNHTSESGQNSRVICSTIGAAVDLESDGLRRLLVNACFWAVGLERRIPGRADVRYVGDYRPSYFGNNAFKRGVKPADLNLKANKER
jgi:hypothetical protein